ncbi:aminodeoxychorismate lyase [Alteromonas sp. LMIT006]|uniref:aminodeoxychorismate lyase n=1 Tax=Alteromonadaceae TaxID=72275 RepID=UPI0020CA7808|nr:aminodeoxychorismate lyase [Alteromonas sp. LMIT006]UTP71979.1 aminodeoxychorismate lyase [Alteromonas sp. LMIT006]
MQIIRDAMSLSSNRNFNYGDGCFTTMRVESGRVEFLSSHLTRLQHDSAKLMITQIDWSEVMQVIEDMAKKMQAGVLKVLICRGEGGRGYDPKGVNEPLVYCSSYPMPTLNTQPLSVAIAQGYLSTQPMLAGSKHCNRLENVLFKQQANHLGVDDVICLDQKHNVVEATSANILWYFDDRWHIPHIENAGVAGILRAQLIESFQLYDVPFVVGDYGVIDLAKADTVVLCNCVRHLQVVNELRLPINNTQNMASMSEEDNIIFANSKFQSLQQHWQIYLSQLTQW